MTRHCELALQLWIMYRFTTNE